jgi:hypothetical protein
MVDGSPLEAARVARGGPPFTVFSLVRGLAIFSTGVIIDLACLTFAVWVWWQPEPSDDQRSRGVNALWGGHTWVGDPHTDDEYRDFAALLRRNQISDLFLHAGPFESDGSVPEGLIQQAPVFLAAIEAYAPEVRVQAYLGQIEDQGGGVLDLDDPVVRAGILETDEQFLDLGFEGIHYDIEPIYPGDESFLDLLERTRTLTEPRGAVLSVALEQVEPLPGAQRAISLLWPAYNDPTEDYLREVAARVDQVAIMTYDSGMPTDWLFGSYVALQTKRIVETIGDEVTVFMGVPTYPDGGSLRFHSRAEHIESGVRGIRKGLDGVDDERTQDVGIAIFAEWTTTADEWNAYYDAWVRDADEPLQAAR